MQIHSTLRGVYGARRIHAELTLGRQVTVGHGSVEYLMRAAGVMSLPGNKRPKQVHLTPTATNLVDRNFSRNEPNKLWVTDITEYPPREGNIYCAVVLDVFSGRVVGWSIDSLRTAISLTNALSMAIGNRTPNVGVVIHSGYGVQFTSWAFTGRSKRSGLVASMRSIGDCYDNAVMESFWGRVETVFLNRRKCAPGLSWRPRCSSACRSSTIGNGVIAP